MNKIIESVIAGSMIETRDSIRKYKSRVSCVYMLLNEKTGMIYVGRTVDVKRRFSDHYADTFELTNGRKLSNAKRKYGVDSFLFYIIEQCDEKEIHELEQFYLDLLNPFNKNGYNMRKDADPYVKLDIPKETREKISSSLKEYYRDHDNAFKGKKHSDYSKEKIKKNLRNPDGLLKRTVDREKASIRAKENKIIDRLTSWIDVNGHPRHRKILMLNKYTEELIRSFNSIKEALLFLGKKPGSTGIVNSLNGRASSAYGYKWQYAESKI